VTAAGGTTDHYLSAGVDKTVTEGSNDFGSIIAYALLGQGVIIEQVYRARTLALSELRALKEALGVDYPAKCAKGLGRAAKATRNARSATSGVITENIAYFYLRWQPLAEAWVSHYRLYYLGLTGTLNVMIWDSDDTHDEDPAYNSGDPQAYLDLGYELDGQSISSAGRYQFKIIGYSADGSQTKELPVIAVSLGMALDNYPTDLQCVGTQLSWTGVTGADGYYVRVFAGDDADLSDPVWHSGDTLLPSTPTSVDMPPPLPGDYLWSVAAHAYDDTGWTAEITMGISGFTYP
jgi:hypothetical protein